MIESRNEEMMGRCVILALKCTNWNIWLSYLKDGRYEARASSNTHVHKTAGRFVPSMDLRTEV